VELTTATCRKADVGNLFNPRPDACRTRKGLGSRVVWRDAPQKHCGRVPSISDVGHKAHMLIGQYCAKNLGDQRKLCAPQLGRSRIGRPAARLRSA
jgi:hypothetical protein